MELKPGAQLGSYEIVSAIGKGGMGEVWRARDQQIGRDVAIKVSAEQFTDRFEREVRAIGALNHPNICTLYHVGPNFLVMELVEGPTLAERIKQGPLPLEEALGTAEQIAGRSKPRMRRASCIAAGADVDGKGAITPLIAASRNGYLEIVRALLAAKADVDATRKIRNTTAVMEAIDRDQAGDHLEIVRALLQAGANVNAIDATGATALMQAASRGQLAFVRVLLAANAGVNIAPAAWRKNPGGVNRPADPRH